MIDKANLERKDVVVKLYGIEHPNTVKLVSFDDGGVWVNDKSLALELKALAKEQGLQGFLGQMPLIFLPYARIEWMMTDSEHLRK